MAYDPDYHRAYYEKNKERIAVRKREYQLRNADKIREYNRNRPKRPPDEKSRKATADWEERNREYVLFNAARMRARKYGHEFSITLKDVLIPEICPLLGIKIERRRGGHGPKDSSPSLDRLDNSGGYVKGNVWVISWLANKMKATATNEQLLTFARNVQSTFG